MGDNASDSLKSFSCRPSPLLDVPAEKSSCAFGNGKIGYQIERNKEKIGY